MSERTPCIRCGRTIDRFARICPYCNWMQDEPVPAVTPRQAQAAAAWTPPPDTAWRRPVFGAIGAVVLLVGSFLIGSRIHGGNPKSTTAAETPQAAPVPASTRPAANVTLVPDSSPAPISGGEPITSAPASDTASGLASLYDRTDATAVASSEYAQMARRAAAEQQRPTSPIVDPRTIKGNAYPQPAQAPRREPRPASTPAAVEVAVTPPVPEYQPIPQLRLRQNATARIELSIGADGRVHEVHVVDPLPDGTGRLIGAVQSWRFRPATRNGVPVPSSFNTAISFHANE